MNTVRKFVYAALLVAAALHFAPSSAAAEEPAHGKFTLKHDVNWGNAVVPAGESRRMQRLGARQTGKPCHAAFFGL